MSHRDDCPSEYEARRQGRRDYENNGYVRYSTPFDECEEAQAAYMRGQRAAEYDAELEAEERRAAERREYARAEAERDWMEEQWRAEVERSYAEQIAKEEERAFNEHIAQLEAEKNQ